MKKRILALLLAAVMMMALVPTVFAEDIPTSGTCGEYVTWNFDSSTGTLTISGTGPMEDYTGTFAYVGVPWYYAGVVTAVIEPGVTSIGESAFDNCDLLTSVTIPDTVTSIGRSAFDGCVSLTGVTIPSSVTSIGDFAFNACSSLTGVTIPSSVTSIGFQAFGDCYALTGITIPASVTSIGSGAFTSCTSLSAINVDKLNQYYTSVDGVLFSKDMKALCQFPAGKQMKEYQIPAGVTSIEDKAFSGCRSLTSVTIPSGVVSIGDNAFMNTVLTSVTIPNGVTSIGEYAFEWCDALTSVTIPVSVTSIGVGAFALYGNYQYFNVYYGGSQEQWGKIVCNYYDEETEAYEQASFADDAERLTYLDLATIHYNSGAADPGPGPVVPGPETGFTDVKPDAYYADAVAWAVENHLMDGTGNGKFSPGAPTSRAMIMTILARLAGVDTKNSSPWYQAGMDWSKANGVSDGTNPDGAITREQLAVMLYRLAGKPAADVSVLNSYPDASSVHTWTDFPQAMAWAVTSGIITGSDGKLLPQNGAIRAQAAIMLMRYCEKFG